MADRPKLLYILVQDEEVPGSENEVKAPWPRYTRPLLQSTLQLMGCKPRHAFKISDVVFEVIRYEMPLKKHKNHLNSNHDHNMSIGLAPLADFTSPKENINTDMAVKTKKYDANGFCVDLKPLKKRSTVTVSREKFLDVVCDGLAQYQYLGPKQRADLMVACRIRERKASVTVLLCGTSGCGKSTLASLLANRLGITTVVSTDSVRHMMRGFVSERENPLLWASTYHAGECLDPESVAEAKAKRRETKQGSLPMHTLSGVSHGSLTPTNSIDHSSAFAQEVTKLALSNSNGVHGDDKGKDVPVEKYPCLRSEGSGRLETSEALVGIKTLAVEGFKAQSEMVMDSLDRLITAWEAKRESVVVEGVHLSLNFVMGLMKKHPSIIPFMVYISNEDKHLERFAVRAKYMTLDPARNKYVKYIRNIRTIQEYLCKRADKHLVPKVNNTNVDKSVAAIHATVFSCLFRREEGEVLLDQATNTIKVVHQEYKNQYAASALGSKGMFQLIQRRGSSRSLMALMNHDGSVAKAWPLLSLQVDRRPAASIFGERGVGTPLYGPLSVGRAEPVNLQFGSLGLSAWPGDKGDTSENGSCSSGREEGSGSYELLQHVSSSSASSVLPGDGPEKEPSDEVLVSGSEEEVEDDVEGADSDEENSGTELEPVQEDDIEGSVDEESARSDDGDVEYDRMDHDDGYWSYDIDETTPSPLLSSEHPGPEIGKGKPTLSCLRSFDQAAACCGQPQLRRCVSQRTYRTASHKQENSSHQGLKSLVC